MERLFRRKRVYSERKLEGRTERSFVRGYVVGELKRAVCRRAGRAPGMSGRFLIMKLRVVKKAIVG